MAKAENNKNKSKFHVITAFLLNEGSCVFFVKENQWTDNIAQAMVIEGSEILEAQMKLANISAKKNEVLDVYSMEVIHLESGGVEPVAIREKMRVNGPSIVLPKS